MDWTTVTSTIALGLLFIGAIVAIRQLALLRRGHRLDTAPFVICEIEESMPQLPSPAPTVEEALIHIDELDEWAKAKPRAPHRYMALKLQNKQTHIAGAATEVSFRITFEFPKYGTPNTMIQSSHRVRGEIWLEISEIFRIIFADLKGLPAGIIDIDKIEYYDVDRDKYKRSYGYCHWELDNTGEESWDFRTCAR